MSRNEKPRQQSIVDNLADEYRADALRRLSLVSEALTELGKEGDAGPDSGERLNEVKAHAHSIKGTSGTFGFSGLSVIAHTMDDYLNRQGPSGGPHFLDDLERLNGLMKTIINAEEAVPKETAQHMLSALDLDAGSYAETKNKTDKTTALLIMDQGDVRETISRTLEILGLDVIFALDGVEAVELAITQRPDIILITLHNERLSAPEVIQVFAEINATSSVPAIVMVPDTDDDEIAAFLIHELPAGIHTVAQDGKMIRALSGKLVELGIISP